MLRGSSQGNCSARVCSRALFDTIPYVGDIDQSLVRMLFANQDTLPCNIIIKAVFVEYVSIPNSNASSHADSVDGPIRLQ